MPKLPEIGYPERKNESIVPVMEAARNALGVDECLCLRQDCPDYRANSGAILNVNWKLMREIAAEKRRKAIPSAQSALALNGTFEYPSGAVRLDGYGRLD